MLISQPSGGEFAEPSFLPTIRRSAGGRLGSERGAIDEFDGLLLPVILRLGATEPTWLTKGMGTVRGSVGWRLLTWSAMRPQ